MASSEEGELDTKLMLARVAKLSIIMEDNKETCLELSKGTMTMKADIKRVRKLRNELQYTLCALERNLSQQKTIYSDKPEE